MFEQIYNTVDIGIIILDKDLKVTHWNRWMETHGGIDRGRIVG